MDFCFPGYPCPPLAPAGWDAAELQQGLPLAPLQHPLKYFKAFFYGRQSWPGASRTPRGFQGESHYLADFC